jgi:predicted O-methyltransferase YrrM
MPHPIDFLRYTLKMRDPDLMSDLHRAVLWNLASSSCGVGCVVELGAWLGETTVCLAAASRLANGGPVYAVDTFRGSDSGCQPRVGAYGGSTWEVFQQNVRGAGVESHVRAVRATTVEAGRAWGAGDGGPVGLLFIDADHSYAAVREDTETWLPHVVSGGVVAWHDHNAAHPGVVKVVEEVVASGVVVNPTSVAGFFWANKR